MEWRCVWPGPCQLGEGIVWDEARGELAFVDIRGGAVHLFDPVRARHRALPVPGMPAALALGTGALIYVAADADLFVLDRDTGAIDRCLTIEEGRPWNRLNDGKCDRNGLFWVGSMNHERGPKTGALYAIERGGRVVRHLDAIGIANGLSFGPAGMTFTDSDTGQLVLGPLAAAPRVLLTIDPVTVGYLDGAAADEEGAIWIAIARAGMVVRVSPAGDVLQRIALPVSKPTCCAFGGADLRSLYITSAYNKLTPAERAAEPLAGALFEVRTDVRGLVEPRFHL
jgi:sugar lactone lactonase YvrE